MARPTVLVAGAVLASWPLISLAALTAIVVLAVGGRSPVLDEVLIIGLVNLIMVIGLSVFVGNSGVVSFGQVSFMAIGAYVSGMFTLPAIAKPVIIPNAPGVFRHVSMGTSAGVLVGALVAGVVAAVVSIPLMRLSGIGASIGTLALLIIVNTFFTNWSPGSSGGGNLTRVPTDTTVPTMLWWALAALALAFLYQRSRFGLRVRAAREDEVAARATGVNIKRERRIGFVLSGFLFGVAGGLYGHSVGSFSANDFFLPITFLGLAMLVLGGTRSLYGAVAGTGLLTFVTYAFQQWQNGDAAFGVSFTLPAGTSDLVIAVVLVLVLILLPDGLTRGREMPLPRLRRRDRARVPDGGRPADDSRDTKTAVS